MNHGHPNISVLQKFDQNNIAGAANRLAEDAVFHFFNPLLPDVQGDCVGLNGFQAFFKKMGGLTNGTFKVNPISASAVGDELVVVHSKNPILVDD